MRKFREFIANSMHTHFHKHSKRSTLMHAAAAAAAAINHTRNMALAVGHNQKSYTYYKFVANAHNIVDI